MDILIELIEGSTRTRSDSFREMISGLRSTSTDVLGGGGVSGERRRGRGDVPCLNFWYVVSFYDLGRKVLEREGCCQGAPHGVQVGT